MQISIITFCSRILWNLGEHLTPTQPKKKLAPYQVNCLGIKYKKGPIQRRHCLCFWHFSRENFVRKNVNVAGKPGARLLSKFNLSKVKMTYSLNGLNSLKIIGHIV